MSVPRIIPLSGECSGAYHAYNNTLYQAVFNHLVQLLADQVSRKSLYTTLKCKSVRKRIHFSDSDEEELERSINAVATNNKERRHHYHSDNSDQLKSMEDQIRILVDKMQLLQSKLNSIESKSKEKAETRTCYNCNRQGHIAINCKKPRRQFPRTQNRQF